ncbi:uncharacterized protein LOC100141951 [Tribolium castaneum]|uniref:DUF4794 domain-containing protein n=1 Tax=Tribolium castaneum TaxID=7070 RepID=D6WC36_TRICA|nr:PREDICTED: uncharacterized protein LOC100141951 [Tribolium castaneum]EEZ99119.1 hypothetical protein TcasGA2_TC005225 [Tribolium castaneum]|eukprot:XP_001808385.1 PREDICTED: uncharacterized protein LOC100141951 [Tribolium castaneum]
MQFLLVIALVLNTAFADFRIYNPHYQEQDGPYQPTGWRPSGPPLSLPLRQQLPRQEYGPPPQTYSTPAKEYGPPGATTEEPQETTTIEVPTTTENVQEQLNNSKAPVKGNEKLTEDSSAVTQQGIYYIYHPNGLLQRVIYMTKDDAGNMVYSAQLKYENVDPIREPIYTYDPKTFVLKQLQV